jgi:hypothetical protein
MARMVPTNTVVVVLAEGGRELTLENVERIEVTKAGALVAWRTWVDADRELHEDIYGVWAPGQWLMAEPVWTNA